MTDEKSKTPGLAEVSAKFEHATEAEAVGTETTPTDPDALFAQFADLETVIIKLNGAMTALYALTEADESVWTG